jgi:hypothetical protein
VVTQPVDVEPFNSNEVNNKRSVDRPAAAIGAPVVEAIRVLLGDHYHRLLLHIRV